MNCPTCGGPVTVMTSDEGTSYYVPVPVPAGRAELYAALLSSMPDEKVEQDYIQARYLLDKGVFEDHHDRQELRDAIKRLYALASANVGAQATAMMIRRPVIADLLTTYAEGVQENLEEDDSDDGGDYPVVERYLDDANRIRRGESPLHETTWEVLRDPTGPFAMVEDIEWAAWLQTVESL